MSFGIDDDLIDDACELELEQHGSDAMLPDDEDLPAEPGTLRSAETQPVSHIVAQQSDAAARYGGFSGSQSAQPGSRTTRLLPGTYSQSETEQVCRPNMRCSSV